MKTIAAFAVLFVALTGCATTEPAAHVPYGSMASANSELDPLTQPKLTSHQQWTYRRLDLWKNEETERFSQTMTTGVDNHWSVQWQILSSKDASRVGITEERFDSSTHGFGDARVTGPYEPLRFPLSAGKTWTFAYQFQSKPGTLVDVNQTATVKGWEYITVPAGRFRAMRVVHDGWYSAQENNARWTGRITETYWYAPSALRVVAHEYRDTTGAGDAWDQRRDELVSMQL